MGKVKEIMHTGNYNPIADKNCCFRDVLEIMDSKKLGVVCIVDAGKLVGIITDGDVRRLILKTQDTLPELFMKNVESIMNKNPKTVLQDTSFEDCLAQLGSFWVMPVVDNQKKLLGMIHLQTLLKALVKSG
jgi:arabinose-5-phosphate isomerase